MIGDTLRGVVGRVMAAAGGANTDEVIVTRNGSPAFSAAVRPMDVYVTREARLMEHPVEDGSKVTDHIVYEPTEVAVECNIIGDYRSAYAEIEGIFSQALVLEVSTKSKTYPSMVIKEMPHGEDGDKFDALSMSLILREVVFVQPETAQTEGGDSLSGASDSKSKPTTARGQQSTSTPTRGQAASATSSANRAQTGSTLYRNTFGR